MYLFKPLIAWFLAQVFKICSDFINGKKVNLKRIIDSGGMPSSHAALTVALTTSLGKDFGLNDPLVVTALIFTLVVLYDAAGVRRAVGRQAVVLNKIIEELMQTKQITDKGSRSCWAIPSAGYGGDFTGF